MKLVGALLGGFHTVLGISVSDAKQGCPCQEGSVPPQSLIETASHNLHRLSSVEIRQEHQGSGGLSLPELHERYGSVELSEEQRHRALVLANSSLDCLDDRVDQPVLATPGGELGEFALALAAYMQEKDSHNSPNQEVVDSLFANYLETVPVSRRISLCTDQKALQRVAADLSIGHLDLQAPSKHLKTSGLLEKLAQPESQGDRHFRLLLEHPGEYNLPPGLAEAVLKAFYQQLWQQEAGSSKLQLRMLQGEADPQAFLEVSCQKCGGIPALIPREGPVLVSQLDAPLQRRQELAAFFARASRSTPRKVGAKALYQRIEQLALLALDKTGSHIAAGLPFYTLNYSSY